MSNMCKKQQKSSEFCQKSRQTCVKNTNLQKFFKSNIKNALNTSTKIIKNVTRQKTSKVCKNLKMCVYIYIHITHPIYLLTDALTASLTVSLAYLPTDLLTATNALEKARCAFSMSRAFVAVSKSLGK